VVGDQFALLVSSVVDYAIFVLDPSGVIVTWNEGAQRIKGYRADEIIGRHFSIFYPAEDAHNRKPDWELEIAKREGRYEEEGWRIRKDGTRFWASVVITSLRDETGRLRGFGKVTRDMTERHELEVALREHAARTEELERTKTEFLNLASHELRGPLTVLRGYNSMLQDGSIPAGQIPAVARILETKLAQMDVLIEQMLETARLEDQSLDLYRAPFDLCGVAQEQIDVYRLLTDGHRLILSADEGPHVVVGDKGRIAAIVANLLDNAIKYSPDGGRVRVSCRTAGDHAEVAVTDEGVGIAAGDLDRLFTRFGRIATPETAQIAGTGLGLYLARDLAHRHGGEVGVVSEPGVGSTFTLTLPLATRR
jgi:PAS domain S-box-containing protein